MSTATTRKSSKTQGKPRVYSATRLRGAAEENVYQALKDHSKALNLGMVELYGKAAVFFLKKRQELLDAGQLPRYFQPKANVKQLTVLLPPAVATELKAAAAKDEMSERVVLFNAVLLFYEEFLSGK